MNRSSTCCFTGHRHLPPNQINRIKEQFDQVVDSLIKKGFTSFISGGALGFDQLAAAWILDRKKQGQNIQLCLALPCRHQDDFWNTEQKNVYHCLVQGCDRLIYLADDYFDGCMKQRNQFMVDHACCCICAWLYPRSGTGQTVRYAQRKGLRIFNVATDVIT